MKYKAAIFDFDGTLFDTGVGITSCIKIALDEMNLPQLSQEDLESFIGPSLYDSFKNKCGLEGETVEIAIKTFRKYYHTEGIYQSYMYDGMKELLENLKATGIKVAIASSKPQIMIEKLLEKYNLFPLFDNIIGSNGAERSSDKTKAIANSVRALGFDKSDCIMIGDRKFDINSAKEVGIDSVYALYGYGCKEEMEECGPDYSVDSVDELSNIILQE